MNNKHLALVIVGFLIICIVQGSLSMQNTANKRRAEAEKQRAAVNNSLSQLSRNTLQFNEFKDGSSHLVEYLQKWQSHFNEIDSAQRAELNISLRIKEDNLVSLAQRYEMITLKGNPTVPRALRAYLTFEDNYARVLNWIGRVEQQLPTMRIMSLQLTKGTAANDLRAVIMLDQPLIATVPAK